MLRQLVAAWGLRLEDESRRGGLFKPLTAASVLALACTLTNVPARADGLPDRRESLKDISPAPGCAFFHGFYHGYHVGSGSHDWSWSDRDAWAKEEEYELPSAVVATGNGVIGGLQAGFNWQRGCTVFGVEADWSFAGLDSTTFNTDGDDDDDVTLRVQSQIDGFGTLRTRAGVVVDHLLLYVTGGLAFANIDRRWTLENDDDSETFDSSETQLGWTAGFGAEWALTDRITLKSEALWFRFDANGAAALNNNHDNNNNNDNNNDEHGKRFDLQDNVFVARIGLNFKFDSGAHFPW
jgi:outer membrane immunogenic protein